MSCLAAPAGPREHALALDAARALVAVRRVVESEATYQLRVESFDGSPPVELGRFGVIRPALAGAEALAVRRSPLQAGTEPLTRVRGAALGAVGELVALDLQGGARPLSLPGHDVTSFVVSGDRVFYAAGFSLWEVPLVGGAAVERGRALTDVLAVAPDGTLIATVVGDQRLVLARVRADGSREELGVAAQVAEVADGRIWSQDLQGDPIYVAPLDAGLAQPLPEYQPGDLLVSGAIARAQDGHSELIPLQAGRPKLRVNGGAGRALAPGPGAELVLVAHDTNADGALNGLDEADLCRRPPGQGELSVSPRSLPLELAQARAELEAALAGLGLKLLDLRSADGGAVTTLRLGGGGPDSLGGLGDVAQRLRELIPGSPGVYAVFNDSGRFGAFADIGVPQVRAGYAGALLWTRPADLPLELRGVAVRPEGGERACSARVRNLGPAPRALVASCGPYAATGIGFGWLNGPPPEYRRALGELAPGAEAAFSVLAEGPEAVTDLQIRLREGETEVPTLNPELNARAEAVFRALVAIAGDELSVAEHHEGGLGISGGFTSQSSVPDLRSATARVAPAFELRAPAERPESWRQALAATATRELEAIEDPPALWLRSEGGIWELSHGVFLPRAQPTGL